MGVARRSWSFIQSRSVGGCPRCPAGPRAPWSRRRDSARDLWETREQGDRFVNEQLNPILERFMAQAPEGEFTPPTLDSWYDLHDTMS
jgi:hypothetical protein